MSLNFFQTKPQKTDATLQFSAVLENLSNNRSSTPLNIDHFIKQENIHLDPQHQESFKESTSETKEVPESITAADAQTPKDARLLANALTELSNKMPSLKSEALQVNETIKVATQKNEETIYDIQSIQPAL